ncbi:hypothetical protein F4Z99_05505 [Candidatus Poribacteria bacterium]|nr:hypothetical protein [Candidatus Poribacteria bacterium]
MKFLSLVSSLTLILLLALLLSVVLTFLTSSDDSHSLSDILAIAREEGWIHGPDRASVIWEEYQARTHAVAHLEAKHILIFLIAFFVLSPIYWWVVKNITSASETIRTLRRGHDCKWF